MSGGGELDVRARYEDVCAELNMDEETAKKAWSSYEEVNNDYVLEVSQAPAGCGWRAGEPVWRCVSLPFAV